MMKSEDVDEAASKAEKEMQLSARMEQIRIKNAQLQKRYEEVKADKLNADTSSNEFHEKHRTAKDENIPNQNKVERISVKSRLGPISTDKQQQRQPRYSVAAFKPRTEDDKGPPPDPKYSFLSDRSRENRDDYEMNTPTNENNRRHPSNYGGRNAEDVESNINRRQMHNSYRGPPRNKMEKNSSMTGRERRAYDAWKKERKTIESERVNRQKTSSGQWRREWDKDKNDGNDSNHSRPTRSPRGSWNNNFPKDNYQSEGFNSAQHEPKHPDLRIKLDRSAQSRRVLVTSDSPKEAQDLQFKNVERDTRPIYKENPINHSKTAANSGASADKSSHNRNLSEGIVPYTAISANTTGKFERLAQIKKEDDEGSSRASSWADDGSWEEDESSDSADNEKNKIDDEENGHLQDKKNHMEDKQPDLTEELPETIEKDDCAAQQDVSQA